MTAPAPAPPVGVVLIYADGRKVPVTCTYAGTDDDLLHRWDVLVDSAALAGLVEVDAETLPPRTSLWVKVAPPDPDRCASCGAGPERLSFDPADGWSCSACGRSDADET